MSEDRYNMSYQGAPSDGSAWEAGAVDRVLRGGSCYSGARYARVAYLDFNSPGSRDNYGGSVGFRLARTAL